MESKYDIPQAEDESGARETTAARAGNGRSWLTFDGSNRSKIVVAILLFLVVATTTGHDCLWRACSSLFWGWVLPDEYQQATKLNATAQTVEIYMEIAATGVFTPTASSGSLFSLASNLIGLPAVWDELASKGYLAIRVPHAPPTYPLSTLLPGIPPWEPNAIEFTYYSPPSSNTPTTVAVTVTRRTEYEPIINARYPITDGRSHWEVWWLPAGNTFPIPNAPFQLGKKNWAHNDPFQVRFRLDFGAGTNAGNCAGCILAAVLYNGYTFIGPYEQPLRLTDPAPLPPGNPVVAFGSHCEATTVGTQLASGVPFTFTQWLENWERASRVYTVTTASRQNWGYTYYYRAGAAGALVRAPSPPFTVSVGAATGDHDPGCLGVYAVYTPTFALSDPLRETYTITATSRLSPTVRAVSFSFAVSPGYQLNEGAAFRLYLPIILSNYTQ